MKTMLTRLAYALFLFPLYCGTVHAQQNTTDKKIVITKHTVLADGSESTETIVKKGAAAENFDVEKYLQENKSATTDVNVRIENGKDQTVVMDGDGANKGVRGWGWSDGNIAFGGCDNGDKHGFLGVEPDSDDASDDAGVTVQVVRNSAAAKAGLKTNDLILQLNNTKTEDWDDLSTFLNTTLPGDHIKVTYRRNGSTATTTAALTKSSEVNKYNCENKKEIGFFGVSDEGDDDEAETGVRISVTRKSAAAAAGLEDDDRILQLDNTEIRDWEDLTDFMSETVPNQNVMVLYEREGKKNTAQATLGAPQQNEWGSKDWSNNVSVASQDKEACLGIYSNAAGEGAKKGAEINDFTTESAARDASMQVGDLILSVNEARTKGHQDVWDEIAKYKPGQQVTVAYLRDGQPKTVAATLKACKNNSSRVTIGSDNERPAREFSTWNWNNDDNQRLRDRKVITIRKGEGDAPQANTPPPTADRTLQLISFKAYPNPSKGPVTLEFRGEALPTTVTLFDLSGKQLFSEELNGFNGEYNQQFDFSAYAKGNILVQVAQGGKVFTEQVVVE